MTQMAYPIDSVDQRILLMLQENPRVRNAQIGRKLGISGTAVKKRIDKLLENDIFQIAIRLNATKFGYDRGFLVGIELDMSKAEEVTERLMNITEVRWAAFTTGTFELTLLIKLSSSQDVLDFMRKELQTLPGVKKAVVSLLLKEFKVGWDWPLPGPEGELKRIPMAPIMEPIHRRRSRTEAET